MELPLYRGQVGENIGMVVLDVVDNQSPGAVVDKLGALIEKGGIVFIGLDDKILAITDIGERCGKIPGHTANEVTRLKPVVFQYPRQHARSGGLAVGTGNSQNPALRQ